MKGYIGLTDPEWYAFLKDHQRVDEVNFWQPHGNKVFRALSPGELFFFKLRAPQKAIAGFGFFERFESLPAWMAWDCFGQMNGARDFQGMLDRIGRLRKEKGPVLRTGGFQIGCIMLSAPIFFREDEWVTPPADWAPTGIQQGKGYDLTRGEGLRIFNECLARAHSRGLDWNVDNLEESDSEIQPRYGTPIPVRPRLGQGLFSLAVRDAYSGACAVTREHSVPVLEAAHIKPYAQGGEHRVTNGILLRRDLHRLYDLGYASITPDYIFRVGDRLRDEFRNGRSYYSLNELTIALPGEARLHPNHDLLDWHTNEVFRG